MKHKFLAIAALATLLLAFPAKAEARDYCREYSVNIRIGGKLEAGYGQACRRDGGVWEIVKLGGPDRAREKVRKRIYDDLHDRNTRIVIIDHYHMPYGQYKKAQRYYSSYYPRYYDYPHYSAFVYYGDDDRRKNHKRSHRNKHKKEYRKHH